MSRGALTLRRSHTADGEKHYQYHHDHPCLPNDHQSSTLTETPDSNGDVMVSGDEKRRVLRVVAGVLGTAGRKAWARERTRTMHSSRSVDAAPQKRPLAILLVAKLVTCAPLSWVAVVCGVSKVDGLLAKGEIVLVAAAAVASFAWGRSLGPGRSYQTRTGQAGNDRDLHTTSRLWYECPWCCMACCVFVAWGVL